MRNDIFNDHFTGSLFDQNAMAAKRAFLRKFSEGRDRRELGPERGSKGFPLGLGS